MKNLKKGKPFLSVFIAIVLMHTSSLVNDCFGSVDPIGEAKITGLLHHSMGGDTLVLSYWESATSSSGRYDRALPAIQIPVVLTMEGRFEITVPIYRKAQYVSLMSGMKKKQWKKLYGLNEEGEIIDISKGVSVPILNLDRIILEPGDDIQINGLSGDLEFSGRGSDKVKFIEQVANSTDAPKEFSAFKYQEASQVRILLDHYNKRQQFALNLLKAYKESFSPIVYEMLMADIVGENQIRKIYLGENFNLKDSIKRAEFLKLYKDRFIKEPVPLMGELHNEALALSLYFSEFILARLAADESYYYYLNYPNGKPKSREAQFETILTKYDGLLRDKLLTLFCHNAVKIVAQADMERYLTKAVDGMEDSLFKSIIESYRDDFSRGATAYNFTMLDPDGNKVQLKDFLGKVVFVDMWFTGCGACTVIAKAMREFEKNFKDDEDVVFLSVSIDRDKRLWMNSITKDAQKDPEIVGWQYPGEHYSGEKSIYLNTLNGSDDPFIKKYVTLGYPTLLIIDKKGKVFSFSATRPIGKKGQQLLMDEINEARNKS